MLENLFCAAVAILAVWGCMALAYALLWAFTRPKQYEETVLLLYSEGSVEDTVQRVSVLLSRLSVLGELRYTRIAVLCEKSDHERLAALKSAFGADGRVVICGAEDFYKRFLRRYPMYGTRDDI